VVQNFVHGANVAIAHLQHEAVLSKEKSPQAGRPFVVTDPNPPITYSDLYMAIRTLSIHPFRVVVVPPVLMLLLSHCIEWYSLLPYNYPFLKSYLPKLGGDTRHLKPALFSICTHLVASDVDSTKPVENGGLGYKGVLTTLEGMTMELLEWNMEHGAKDRNVPRKTYTTSVSAADKIMAMGAMAGSVAA
jgi:hypothetical protein